MQRRVRRRAARAVEIRRAVDPRAVRTEKRLLARRAGFYLVGARAAGGRRVRVALKDVAGDGVVATEMARSAVGGGGVDRVVREHLRLLRKKCYMWLNTTVQPHLARDPLTVL